MYVSETVLQIDKLTMPVRWVVSKRVSLVIWPIVERSFGSVMALVFSLV